MRSKSILFLAAACSLSAAAAQGTAVQGTPNITASPAPGGGLVIRRQPAYTQSMQALQESADRLRQSIQALADKPPGPDRDQAIAKAHEALLRTQQAMVALPPELRTTGTVSTTAYDESVRKLMKSADSLRQAIQEMAQQPAGERRDRAIAEANRALWDTQLAMASAYQPDTRSMGAGGAAGESPPAALPGRSAGSPPPAR
jgi:hypothetical protein